MLARALRTPPSNTHPIQTEQNDTPCSVFPGRRTGGRIAWRVFLFLRGKLYRPRAGGPLIQGPRSLPQAQQTRLIKKGSCKMWVYLCQAFSYDGSLDLEMRLLCRAGNGTLWKRVLVTFHRFVTAHALKVPLCSSSRLHYSSLLRVPFSKGAVLHLRPHIHSPSVSVTKET